MYLAATDLGLSFHFDFDVQLSFLGSRISEFGPCRAAQRRSLFKKRSYSIASPKVEAMVFSCRVSLPFPRQTNPSSRHWRRQQPGHKTTNQRILLSELSQGAGKTHDDELSRVLHFRMRRSCWCFEFCTCTL